ncbi:MAG: indole-3-glycerol phosphate synthase TrpC [Nitriliruptoraceae bacterium]
MGSYLDDLLAGARTRVAADRQRVTLAEVQRAAEQAPNAPSFRQALNTPDVAVIAEVKRASPSKGMIAPQLDAVLQASKYIAGGAAAISVLTEPEWFHGSLADLIAVSALGVPTLRKEFIVDPYQVFEARAAGAAAVLLIVAALDEPQLHNLYDTARSIGLDVLVEVHDTAEAQTALGVGAEIIGVNARDLCSFTLDPNGFQRVRDTLPDEVIAIAESGVRTPEDVMRYARQGAAAVLIGEQFVRAEDPQQEVQKFVAAGRGQVSV